MGNRGYFRLASFCLLLCAVPSRPLRLHGLNVDANETADTTGDRKWNNENASDPQLAQVQVGKRETNLSTRGIPGDKPGCWIYCVKQAVDAGIDPAKRINVIWRILDDPGVTFAGEPPAGRDSPLRDGEDFVWESTTISNTTNLFADYDRKCEFHLEIGCDARNDSRPLPTREYANRDEVSLATMDHADGYTESVFTVSEVTEELRVSILGKLSQAILEIPAASRAGDAGTSDAETPRATLSLSRTDDGTGMRLDARNPPAGGWRLKLFGVANSNYSFSVVAASTKAVSGNVDVFATATTQPEESARPNEISSTSSRPAHLKLGDDNAATIKSDDQQTLGGQFVAGKQSADEPQVLEFSSGSNDSIVQSEARELMEKKFVRKSARAANVEVEMMKSQTSGRIVSGGSSDEGAAEAAKIVEDAELEELSRSPGEVQTQTRKTVVELSPNAQLIAKPPFHDVVFTVTNNQPLGIRHAFQGSSTVFPFVGILPANALWIRSGETIQVAVRVRVPDTQDSSPGIVTLYVGGNENFEVAKKSTYLYPQGANGLATTDTDKPSIDYTFNDNCNGKLSRDRCSKSLWSVEVTAKDSDSGLKTVTSQPLGLEPRTEFIAGTKSAVSFYYVSSCCYTTVDVKATDVQGNVYTRTIDVTDWDNLSQGEIAAIVVGSLLIILLIILIILLVVYCVRRRKSHDLSYSQRYGSRTPASTERTNF